ncbi:MAG: amidohydrolase family protein, partial [Myxococcota bacterium]
ALTLLPVAYFCGGFKTAAELHQRRFVHADADAFCRLWSDLASLDTRAKIRLGIAPHSLRAVPERELEDIISSAECFNSSVRIHIHVAEQPQEVDQAQAYLGARPVQWLLDHHAVDAKWCLVHATHTDHRERAEVARRCAVVGLCPSTEADLGDGIFAAAAYRAEGGHWGIGSDSNTVVSPARELSLLEWTQRLEQRQRLVMSDPLKHVGRTLFDDAARGGAQALDQPIGHLSPGQRADFVVLNPEHPRLVGLEPDQALDAWIFSGADRAVDEVWVAGQRLVQNGQHHRRAPIQAVFATVMRRLAAGAI